MDCIFDAGDDMIEVLKQALDAFHQIFESTPVYHNDGTCIINDKSVELSNKAIASLRQAIAELESQEPVAIVREQFVRIGNKDNFQRRLRIAGLEGNHLTMSSLKVNDKLFTHPSQRTWVGLTDDEHCDIWYKESLDWMEYGKAIEAKLKQKNGYAEEKNT